MATFKTLAGDMADAFKGGGNILNEGVNSMKGIFGGAAGGGKSVLGSIGGFALDLISAPFKAIAHVGNNHPRLGLLVAAAATIVGFGWWKEKRAEDKLKKQIETEQKISTELANTGQMMQEAYGLVAAQQQQAQPNQWQNRIGGERQLAEQQAAYGQRFPN